MLFTQVDPNSFIDPRQNLPGYGRGAWTSLGKANGSWRYEYLVNKPKVGSNAEKSLDAWATCAGAYAYQQLLMDRGYLRELGEREVGLYGPDTRDAVKLMQADLKDPESGKPLDVDGTIGTSDARALVTPVIDKYEDQYGIPNHYLRGETNLESRLDAGALGYTIYYGTALAYRGVDRGISQINSVANEAMSWPQAFMVTAAISWSAARMRGYYDKFRSLHQNVSTLVLWDAALCAHNNPSAATSWARLGAPPTVPAAQYVNNAKAARY